MGLIQTTGKFQFSSVSGNQTANMGANFTAGNGGVVAFNHYNGGTPGNRISGVTIGGTAATLAVRVIDAANQNTWECWSVPKSTGVAGGTTQVVLTLPAGAGQFITGSAEEWDDNDTVDTGVTGTGAGASTAPSATTGISTSVTPVRLYGGFVDTVGTNWTSATAPASWTKTWDEVSGTTQEAGAGGYFLDNGATGAKTGTWTTGASMTWSAAIVAFKLASTAPTISAHPVGNAAAVSATAQYSITASGATSYQWQVSTNGGETWSNVVGGSGATTATYTTPTTTAADNGKQYRCVATNANGSTNSLGAWFHVSGIGLTGRGRWTSRGHIPVRLPDSSPVLLTRDILTAPHPNDTKSDNIASAFRDLYFYADPAASVAAAEFPHWTWSTQNRPGIGPLSTGVFYVSQQRVWAPSSSDATVSLTGVSATGSAGTLGVTVDKALTGVAATGGVGALTASISAALSGAQAATGAGGLGPTVSVAISGAGATASVGDVAPSAAGSVAISGVSSTGAAGSLSADVSLALGGLQASGEVGSLSPGREISVSGVSAASAAGSLSASVSVALSGQAAASAVGTVSLGGDVSIAISGVSATGLVGSVSPLGAEASGGWPIAAMVSEMRRRRAREAERLKALEEEERKREQALTIAKSQEAKQKAKIRLDRARDDTLRQERLLGLLIAELADAMKRQAEEEEEREILEILAEWM